MKKVLVVIFLLLIAAAIVYVTFVIAAVKMVVGSILLGISLIALLVVWIMWKVKSD